MFVSGSRIPRNIHSLQELPKNNSIPSASKIKKQKQIQSKSNTEHQALGSYVECFHQAMSPKDSPEPSGFFDVRLDCGQRHLGIERGFWVLLADKSTEPSRR
jgi:hypothetical protein